MRAVDRARGEAEAARLKGCREAFERAMARGIGLADARYELAVERWRAAGRRLAERRCGTTARTPMATIADDDGAGRELKWFQR